MERITRSLPEDALYLAGKFARSILPAQRADQLANFVNRRPGLPLVDPITVEVSGVSVLANINTAAEYESVHPEGSYFERRYLRQYIRTLKSISRNRHVWDVGSCSVAPFTLFAARLGFHVDSFDPDTRMARPLARNFDINGFNGNVVHHEFGLGVGSTTQRLHLGAASSFVCLPGSTDTVQALVVGTDEFVRNSASGVPAVVKIDVEGMELDVLKGGKCLFTSANKPKHLFIEIHRRQLKHQGLGRQDVYSLLSRYGYEEVFRYDRINRANTTHHCHFQKINK